MQEYFSEIKDPRHEGYVKHKLADVLTDVCNNVPNERTLRNNGFCRKQSRIFGFAYIDILDAAVMGK